MTWVQFFLHSNEKLIIVKLFYIKIFFSSKSDSCKTLVNPSCPVLPHHLVYLCALCIRLVSGTQPGSCSERIGRVTPATVLLLQFTQTEASARPRSFIGYRRYLSHDFRLPLLLFFLATQENTFTRFTHWAWHKTQSLHPWFFFFVFFFHFYNRCLAHFCTQVLLSVKGKGPSV